MSEKQIAALYRASKNKQEEALKKTELAIEYLMKSNLKITIRSVAKEAGVSVSFIYKHPQIVTKIKKLKERQKKQSKANKYLSTNNSNTIDSLQRENTNLFTEIARLKAYIKAIEDNKKSLIELQKENQELKQELEFTQLNLQEVRKFLLENGYDSQDEIIEERRTKIPRKVFLE